MLNPVTLTPSEVDDVIYALRTRQEASERFARTTKREALRVASLQEADKMRDLAASIVRRGAPSFTPR